MLNSIPMNLQSMVRLYVFIVNAALNVKNIYAFIWIRTRVTGKVCFTDQVFLFFSRLTELKNLKKEKFNDKFFIENSLNYSLKNSIKVHPCSKGTEHYKRPYMCNICGKSYGRVSILKKHRATVHNKMNMPKYTCPHCGKMFVRKEFKYSL